MAEVYPLLHVRTASAGGVVTVTVRGEVDLATVGRLRRALAGVPTGPEVRLVVCDLTHVSFLACCGLTALVDLQRIAERLGAGFELVATGPAVLRPLALTGLADRIPVRSRPSTVDKPGARPRDDGKVGG